VESNGRANGGWGGYSKLLKKKDMSDRHGARNAGGGAGVTNSTLPSNARQGRGQFEDLEWCLRDAFLLKTGRMARLGSAAGLDGH